MFFGQRNWVTVFASSGNRWMSCFHGSYVFDYTCMCYACIWLYMYLFMLVSDFGCFWLYMYLIIHVFQYTRIWLYLYLTIHVYSYTCTWQYMSIPQGDGITPIRNQVVLAMIICNRSLCTRLTMQRFHYTYVCPCLCLTIHVCCHTCVWLCMHLLTHVLDYPCIANQHAFADTCIGSQMFSIMHVFDYTRIRLCTHVTIHVSDYTHKCS